MILNCRNLRRIRWWLQKFCWMLHWILSTIIWQAAMYEKAYLYSNKRVVQGWRGLLFEWMQRQYLHLRLRYLIFYFHAGCIPVYKNCYLSNSFKIHSRVEMFCSWHRKGGHRSWHLRKICFWIKCWLPMCWESTIREGSLLDRSIQTIS